MLYAGKARHGMREHRYTLDIPHSPARIWTLMNDYARWPEFAPMVIAVEVLYPGDALGNGLLRRVLYQLPFGRRGTALEMVTAVDPERAYTFTMIGRQAGNDQTGKVRLEPRGSQTRLHFEERYNLTSKPWKWFEAPIYRFINRKNEESMQRLSEWLTAHPQYPLS
jgi:hypothetical protein